MDEAVVADVEADVRDASARSAEKHHVTRLEFAATDRHTHFRLLCRCAGQVDLHGFAENVLHEAATVETAVDGCSAETVADAEQTHCIADQFVCFAAGKGGGTF